MPQLSGRGLGHTGGTLDKLESIPGWRASLSIEEIAAQLAKVGAVICATTPTLAPADSATPPIAVAQDSDGATNSRWYREDGALTDPQPRKSPRSMALRSHVASGTARTAACVNAGPRPLGSASSMKNAIRFFVFTAWYFASI